VFGGVLVERAQRAAADAGDDEWEAWGELSDCSRTCGGGIQHQQRTCKHIGYSLGCSALIRFTSLQPPDVCLCLLMYTLDCYRVCKVVAYSYRSRAYGSELIRPGLSAVSSQVILIINRRQIAIKTYFPPGPRLPSFISHVSWSIMMKNTVRAGATPPQKPGDFQK